MRQLLAILGNETKTLSELEAMVSEDEQDLPVLTKAGKGGRNE